jgi:hypothetical protein
MDKLHLVSTFEKYYLNGTVERVKMQVKDKNVAINFVAPNKDLVGCVNASEFELEDTYRVYWDHLYVCDGKIIKSDIQGTVADLKRDLQTHFKLEAKVITNCDIIGRNKLIKVV